jgi:hypothetical protein
LPLLDDAIAVRDTVTRLIADVHAGKVEPKVIAVLTDFKNLRLRALDAVKEFESLETSHLLTIDMQARRRAIMAGLRDDGSE